TPALRHARPEGPEQRGGSLGNGAGRAGHRALARAGGGAGDDGSAPARAWARFGGGRGRADHGVRPVLSRADGRPDRRFPGGRGAADVGRGAGGARVAVPLWVARHAEVEVEGLCYGQLDVPPRIPHGEAAARLEADLGGFRPDRVWTSPLARCLGPATEVALRLARPLSVEPRRLELSFGALDGRRWAE